MSVRKLITGDVTDAATLPSAIANVDVVYHLAGLTKANRLSDYLRTNEQGVRNLVEICARLTTPPVVVLVSSLAAAGPMPQRNRWRTESDPPAPVSHYGISKLAGERAAEAFADRVPITIIRPPMVLGPGDVTGFALFQSIHRMRSYLVLGLPRRASIVHVADLNTALIAAAQHGERLPARDATSAETECPGCGRYYVAADEHPTFSELSRMVARSVNRPYALPIQLPLVMIWPAVMPGEIAGRITGRPRYLCFELPANTLPVIGFAPRRRRIAIWDLLRPRRWPNGSSRRPIGICNQAGCRHVAQIYSRPRDNRPRGLQAAHFRSRAGKRSYATISRRGDCTPCRTAPQNQSFAAFTPRRGKWSSP